LEQLEERFIALAAACALVSWLAAIALALWLAQRVMRPVSQLADLVKEWRPGDHQRRLTPQFGDQEIGMIATAFDGFIERMEAFVAREQAFTEDASHELRTPLAVIDSASQLLADDPQLPATARERVQRILRAVQQMQMLIEALLFLAREDGQHASEEMALHQLVADIADNHRELIGSKSLELALSTIPTVLRAPRGMANCVISNLLLNAIHYTERGRIEVRVEPGRLSVQDTGIGIPPQDLERIFERRFRGTQSRGLGLGLYLVKRICDRLDWQVEVTSRSEQGARFDLFFSPNQRNPNEPPTP
jgi:signal transduction histidine kinase